MDATGIRQEYCDHQLSEVGQKSAGVAILLTENLQFNCEKLALILALHSVSLTITERIQAISIP